MIDTLLIINAIMVWCLIRQTWVCHARLTLLEINHNKFKKLPSFLTMMLKCWIWDVNKFIVDPN